MLNQGSRDFSESQCRSRDRPSGIRSDSTPQSCRKTRSRGRPRDVLRGRNSALAIRRQHVGRNGLLYRGVTPRMPCSEMVRRACDRLIRVQDSVHFRSCLTLPSSGAETFRKSGNPFRAQPTIQARGVFSMPDEGGGCRLLGRKPRGPVRSGLGGGEPSRRSRSQGVFGAWGGVRARRRSSGGFRAGCVQAASAVRCRRWRCRARPLTMSA
jgi:hypothetical protein